MIALIGIVLIGIVKKNAIMKVDVAIHLERNQRREGKEAIHEAAVVRLRSIMMTTATAVLGAMPLAIGIGQGGTSLRQPFWYHRDGRPHPQSDPHAQYDAGHLSFCRSPAVVHRQDVILAPDLHVAGGE